MSSTTLHLRSVAGRTSKTWELRFVDRAGRYILQQMCRVKYPTAPTRDEWRDVVLYKEKQL